MIELIRTYARLRCYHVQTIGDGLRYLLFIWGGFFDLFFIFRQYLGYTVYYLINFGGVFVM